MMKDIKKRVTEDGNKHKVAFGDITGYIGDTQSLKFMRNFAKITSTCNLRAQCAKYIIFNSQYDIPQNEF